MTNMLESFYTVSKHLSAHRPSIQLLFHSSPVFRETCMDYHTCSRALNYWRSLSSEEAALRTQEYSVLLQELKEELLQCISLFDEVISVNNVQNKGENER